jgi:hypothetical protein
LDSNKAQADISMPGVQMPHCAAPARRKARCPYERPARQPGIAVLDL